MCAWPNGSVLLWQYYYRFKDRLNEKKWLDDTTKKRCVEKVNAITEMVAYPDQIQNDTYLEELYAEVSLLWTEYESLIRWNL